MNHISDFGYDLNVFCINQAGLPTVSMNGVKSCKITKELLETGVSGQYSK
jgi:hypothetical protein